MISNNMLDLTKKIKRYNGEEYITYHYTFIVDDIEMVCVISPKLKRRGYYEVCFNKRGNPSALYRVSKGLVFMNNVLLNVTNCMMGFIKYNNVRVLTFESNGVRGNAYVRYLKNHHYFSKFKVKRYSGGLFDIRIKDRF